MDCPACHAEMTELPVTCTICPTHPREWACLNCGGSHLGFAPRVIEGKDYAAAHASYINEARAAEEKGRLGDARWTARLAAWAREGFSAPPCVVYGWNMNLPTPAERAR